MMKKIGLICIVIFILVIVIMCLQNSMDLSVKEVDALISSKGIDSISWGDFEKYPHKDVGSGNYVYRYELSEGSYLYLSGGDLDTPPMYIYIIEKDGKRVNLK